MVSVGVGWEFPEELSLKTERVRARSSPYPIELKQEHKAKSRPIERADEDFGGRV